MSFTTAEEGLDVFLDTERSYVENGLRVCMESYILRLESHLKCHLPVRPFELNNMFKVFF